MKKVLVALVSVVIAVSVSAVVFASTDVDHGSAQLTKQLVLSDENPPEEPAPAPVPEPTPSPEPEPEPK